MELFTTTHQQQKEFRAYREELRRLEERLRVNGAPQQDVERIHALGERFTRRVDDFFRENRRLNIGVVGQVKAGKSSFLNTLLFEGRQILPKAATPKTAVLTKIEYSPENRLLVQYLPREEWDQLEQEVRETPPMEGERTAAQELVDMVRERRAQGLDLMEKLGQTEELPCASVEELQGMLNDYVGENGRYTPIVEYVTLGMNREELRELSIVDTPGLNDPIISRTDQTRKFLEVCDVVFFLSQSGSFLDSSDWDLLSEQLPNQGVKRMILIASKADSAVLDLLWSRRGSDGKDPLGGGRFRRPRKPVQPLTLADAWAEVNRKLTARAKGEIERYGKRAGTQNSAYQALCGCQEPCPVSAMLENMRRKPREAFDREEENIYQRLQSHFQDEARDMEQIGNFETVRMAFDQVVRDKEEILLQKGREMLPTARAERCAELKHLRDKALRRRDALEHGDQNRLQQQIAEIKRQENALKGGVKAIFGEAGTRLEQEKSAAVSEMRTLCQDHSKLLEHSGTEEHTGTRTYYRHHFLFFKWGKEVVSYTYTTSYRYMLASDAAEQLRIYAGKLSSGFEEVFREAVNFQEVKGRLLNAVVRNLDTSHDAYDAGLCKQAAEEVIQSFHFPQMSFSFEKEVQAISARFKGEIKTSTEKEALKELFARGMAKVLENAVDALEQETKRFDAALAKAGEQFTKDVLAKVQEEYQELLTMLKDRQRELEQAVGYYDLLENILGGEADGT